MQAFSQMLSEYDYDMNKWNKILRKFQEKEIYTSPVSWLIGKSNYYYFKNQIVKIFSILGCPFCC